MVSLTLCDFLDHPLVPCHLANTAEKNSKGLYSSCALSVFI